MTFEVSKFGNGVLTGSGGNVVQNVHNSFNTRKLGGQAGVFETDGAINEITLTLTAEQLQRDAVSNDAFLVPLVLPVGAVITRTIVQVKQAFSLTGTSPVINIGTEGTEGTNGFTITKTQAEAVGTYTGQTLNGTWTSPIATAATIGVALGGTSPVVAGTAGSLDVLISYMKA